MTPVTVLQAREKNQGVISMFADGRVVGITRTNRVSR